MSWFDETIDDDSFQAGSGIAVNSVPGPLAGVRDIDAFKKVIITNNNQAALTLLIHSTNTPDPGDDFNYRLPPGAIVELELKRPAEILVSGLSGSPEYSWCAM